MRKLSLAATIFGISLSSAQAGSFETIDVLPDDVIIAAATDWSGAYVGAFGGYDFGTIATNDIDNLAVGSFQIIDIPVEGGSGGIFAGYNWQRGHLVFGVEADFALGGASGSNLVDTANLDETLEWQSNWSASIRGRVGFAKNSWLIYGTAGYSQLNANVGYLNLDDPLVVIEDDGRVDTGFGGWSAGVGVEKMIGEHLVVRGEFMQSGYTEAVLPLYAGSANSVGFAPSISTIRAAIIWSF